MDDARKQAEQLARMYGVNVPVLATSAEDEALIDKLVNEKARAGVRLPSLNEQIVSLLTELVEEVQGLRKDLGDLHTALFERG